MAVINRCFEARNDNKVCIIDDNYKNFGLKASIPLAGYEVRNEWQLAGYDTTVLNTIFTGVSYMMINVKPFNAQNLLAISCGVSDLSCATYVHNDILTIYIIRKDRGDYHNNKDAEYALQNTEILHYTPTENITNNARYGLQVFNAEGHIVFNSANRYLKVVDVISQDIDDVSDINRTYAQNIAIIPLSCRYTATYHPQRVRYYRHFFTITNHRRLNMVPVVVNSVPPGSSYLLTGYFYNTNLLVIKKDI